MPAPYDPIPIFNDSGEPIPAHAVVEPTGGQTRGALHVGKPTSDGARGVLVLDGAAVPVEGWGQAYAHPRVVVLADGEPAVGAEWGPKAGEWHIADLGGGGGFISLGGYADGRVNAIRGGVGPVDSTGSPAGGDNCVKKFPRRTTDCLEVEVTDPQGLCTATEAAFGAAWVEADDGWVGDELVETPIGDGRLVIWKDADGDFAASIEVDETTFIGTEIGCEAAAADDENQEPWLAWVFGDETLCPNSGSAALTECDPHRFTVRARCGPCVVTVECDDTPIEIPRTLCVTWRWVPALGPSGDPNGCGPCSGAMTVTYGVYEVYYYGVTGFYTGWYGETDNPVGCTYPDGIAGNDGKIHCFIVPNPSPGVVFEGRLGRTAGLSSGDLLFGPSCPFTPPDPFSYTEEAGSWFETGTCAPTSGNGAYEIIVSDTGDCTLPDAPADSCCDGTGETLEAHPDLEVVIPDGPDAGTYTFTWVALSSRYEYAAGKNLTCTAGTWSFKWSATGDATEQNCDPFALIIPAALGGATADITVSIA